MPVYPSDLTDEQVKHYNAVLQVVRGPISRLPEKCPNIEPVDIAIGAVLGALDIMQGTGIDAIKAIEWLRDFADAMEGPLLAQRGGAN